MNEMKITRRQILLGATAATALSGVSPLHAQALKEQVARDGKLTVGIYGARPLGYKTDDGTVEGSYPDLLRAMSEAMGVKKMEFVIMDFGALIPSLVARRIDLIGGGMYITPARCSQVLFSNPVSVDMAGALVKKGNPHNVHSYVDLAKNPNVRVGDIRGASTNLDLIAAGVSKDRLQLFPDRNTAVAALMADRVDVLTFSNGTQNDILRDPNIRGVEPARPFTGPLVNGREKINATGFAMRLEDSAFQDVLNKALAMRIADGTALKVLEKYGYSDIFMPPKGLTASVFCTA